MGNSNIKITYENIKDIIYTPSDENPKILLLTAMKENNLILMHKAIDIMGKRYNNLPHDEFKENMLLFLNSNIISNKNAEDIATENNCKEVLKELNKQKKRYRINYFNDKSLNFLKNDSFNNNNNKTKCTGRYD